MEKGWRRTTNSEFIAHWNKPFGDGFAVSPSDFYGSVEAAFAKHAIPEVEVSRVLWKEGSFLSADREYLRVARRRYVYDICAAPFGKDFFFSSWLVILKPSLSIFHLIGMATTLFFFFYIFTPYWGWVKGAAFLLGILVLVGIVVRNGVFRGQAELEQYLLGLTGIGAFWNVFFHKLTYFEIDTAEMFHTVVHTAVMGVIDGITDAKGLPRLTEGERKPIKRDFFKK